LTLAQNERDRTGVIHASMTLYSIY
jgi:hypothetical protein